MKRCFIYAHYDAENEIKEYVKLQLDFLSKLGDIVFVSDSRSISNIEILPSCIYIQIGNHSLYDVYSYFSGYKYLKDSNKLKEYDIIYFINDSIVFPVCSEDSFLNKIISMEYTKCHIWGMCKSYYLLQTYWLGCKKSSFEYLDEFIKNYKHCTDENLNSWWDKSKDNPWVQRKYTPRKRITNEKIAKKWIYTVVNFETEFSKFMTQHNMILLGADTGTVLDSRFIKKHNKLINKPLISIIITLHNTNKNYVQETLDSLLAQTYNNFEIILIDDYSTTVNYNDLINISPKIRLIRNEVDLGLCKSVNKAFRLANGKYIVRIGSDDIIDATLLEKEVSLLESNNNYIGVCCNLKRFGFAINSIKRPQNWKLNKILSGNIEGIGYAGGMMFRSSALVDCSIDENFKICEDFDFHLQLLEKGNIKVIKEPLYFYRSHLTNITKQVDKQERWNILNNILEKHRSIVQSSNINK